MSSVPDHAIRITRDHRRQTVTFETQLATITITDEGARLIHETLAAMLPPEPR